MTKVRQEVAQTDTGHARNEDMANIGAKIGARRDITAITVFKLGKEMSSHRLAFPLLFHTPPKAGFDGSSCCAVLFGGFRGMCH